MAKRLIHSESMAHTVPDGTVETRTVKVYRDSEWQEYIVTLLQAGVAFPSATYHTQDKQDALGTARMILAR